MMPDLGKYADTIFWAYLVSFLLVAALVVISLWQSRKVKAQLDVLEQKARQDD